MRNIGGDLISPVQHLVRGGDVVEETDLLHLFGQQDAAGEVETPWLGRALAAGTIPDRLRYVTERATELIPVGRPGSVDDVVRTGTLGGFHGLFGHEGSGLGKRGKNAVTGFRRTVGE